MHSGTVAELWRYPVKSMGGERLRSTRVDRRGVGGDRTHAVVAERNGELRPVTALTAPKLLAWRAEYPLTPDAGLDPEDPPPAQVITPDGRRFVFPDRRLHRRLEDELGRAVRLRRDVEGQQDVTGTALVTVRASLEALSEELGRPVDVRRFRPNLVLDLDAPPFAEAGWEGADLEFEGGVVLRFVEPCDRCQIPTRDPETQEPWPDLLRHINAAHATFFGFRVRVVTPGRISVGHTVTVR